MPYLDDRPETTLDYFGSTADCECSTCSGKGLSSSLGQPAATAQATAPVFRFECPAGCAPLGAAQCRTALRRAIRYATFLASNAASKLEANPREASTVRKFRYFFGHDPSRPVPWAGNIESGLSVAHRFRKVAEALQKRGTLYRCGCPGAGAEVRAQTDAGVEPNVVNLCNRFWNPPPGLHLSHRTFRAGVLLHEMLHLLYHEFFHHPGHPSGDPVRRRDNAHCYEAFAMRVAGHAADPSDRTQCRATLAGFGLWGLDETSSFTPWRWSRAAPSRAQRLRFMNLNQFVLNQASLTPRLLQMVRQLAKHVQLSWKTMQPIGIIRLVGHTDTSGNHAYNIGLGNRRAQIVKEALEKLLKDDILKSRVAILTEESPGELNPIGDNKTSAGRARNRRVEVFIEPAAPAPKKIQLGPITDPPPPVIQTTPGPFPWGKPITLPPGKSAKQQADRWMKNRGVPPWLRKKILDAVTGEDQNLVEKLLQQAGIGGTAKDILVGILRGASQVEVR